VSTWVLTFIFSQTSIERRVPLFSKRIRCTYQGRESEERVGSASQGSVTMNEDVIRKELLDLEKKVGWRFWAGIVKKKVNSFVGILISFVMWCRFPAMFSKCYKNRPRSSFSFSTTLLPLSSSLVSWPSSSFRLAVWWARWVRLPRVNQELSPFQGPSQLAQSLHQLFLKFLQFQQPSLEELNPTLHFHPEGIKVREVHAPTRGHLRISKSPSSDHKLPKKSTAQKVTKE